MEQDQWPDGRRRLPEDDVGRSRTSNPGTWIAVLLGLGGLIGVLGACDAAMSRKPLSDWLLCAICGFGLAGCCWLLGMIRNRL